MNNKPLYSAQLETPLGTVLTISDYNYLYLLEFVDNPNLHKKIKRLTKEKLRITQPHQIAPLLSIRRELEGYFKRTLKDFTTPITLQGTPFQKLVWQNLLDIPYAQVRTYTHQAKSIGNPNGARAVANANCANPFMIVIPCHRIVSKSGELSGYSGGVERKKWLIDHEKK